MALFLGVFRLKQNKRRWLMAAKSRFAPTVYQGESLRVYTVREVALFVEGCSHPAAETLEEVGSFFEAI